jgi:hypothetical protein
MRGASCSIEDEDENEDAVAPVGHWRAQPSCLAEAGERGQAFPRLLVIGYWLSALRCKRSATGGRGMIRVVSAVRSGRRRF